MGLALIFPGQGAQEPGMGNGLLDAGSPGNELARDASDVVNLDLVRLACEGTADELRATEVAQPLLLLHSVALLQLVPPGAVASAVAVAGHSLGEYTALVAAGSLGWQDAIRLVHERGQAMAQASAPDQGMSAVLALDPPAVQATIEANGAEGAVAVVANINAPGQVVISGHRAELERLEGPLKAAGARRVIPLQVGGAFHSPLMAGAAERLASAISSAPVTAGRPQAFNVDGAVRTAPGEIQEALRRQLTETVRWVACVQTLGALGVDRFVELGPGSTLAGLGKRIMPGAAWESAATAAAAKEVSN
jgi:[acyl-carrier-protein] S-malonyltransferase